MDLTQLLAKYIASGYVQPQVKEAREINDFCKKIVTGNDHKDIIIKYFDREDKKQKEQRYKLYDSRTQYVSNKTKSVFKQVDRTDGIRESITYIEQDIDKQIEIKERLDKFHGSNSLNKWLDNTYRNLVFKDPNAFICLNITEFDYLVEKPYVYPTIYGSHQQIERIFKNGLLERLVTQDTLQIKTSDGIKPAKQLTAYVAGSAVTVRELVAAEIAPPIAYETDLKQGFYITHKFENKEYKFFAELYSTGSKQVPAVCVGYIKDESSIYDNVFHFPMYGAVHILKELIKKKSTLDTHMALHGILQKFAYVPACDYRNIETGIACDSGKLLNGADCPKCKGTGKMPFHVSEQDIITIELPRDVKEEMFDLSKLVYYQSVPTELIDMHKKAVDELEQKVSLAIFNTNMFDRKELIAGTATEIRANLTHVNNELFDFAEGKAKVWKYLVTQTAIYLENDEGLIVNRTNPTDFKLESESDNIALRTAAVGANAPMEVIKNIDIRILEKQHPDNKEYVEIVKARENWKPFNDKSESERISAITLLDPTDKKRVLYFNFQEIFNEIENAEEYPIDNTNPPFYKLPYKYQKEVVDYYTGLFIPNKEVIESRAILEDAE